MLERSIVQQTPETHGRAIQSQQIISDPCSHSEMTYGSEEATVMFIRQQKVILLLLQLIQDRQLLLIQYVL